MILSIDLEKILTQGLVIVFSIAFIYVTCWAKGKIEKKFREHATKLKSTKKKVFRVKNQDILLCRKTLVVATSHHKRSIVAASFHQTYEEELERLREISNTIKFMNVPTFLPDMKHISTDNLSPKVDTAVAVSVTPEKRGEDIDKKLEHKDKLKPVQLRQMQSKACKTRAREEQVYCDKEGKSSEPQWKGIYFKKMFKHQSENKSPPCEGPAEPTTNAVNCYSDRGENTPEDPNFNHKNKADTERNINFKQLSNIPFVMTALLGGISHRVNRILSCDVKNLISRGNNFDTLVYEEQDENFRTRKETQYTNETSLVAENKKSGLEEVPTTTINVRSSNTACNNQMENIEAVVKYSGQKKCNKTIQIGEGFSKEIKIMSKKASHVNVHNNKYAQKSNNNIFRVLKINKKNITLKLILCFSVKNQKKSSPSLESKRTRNLNSYMTHMKQETGVASGNTPNTSISDQYNTSHLKKYSLYTESSFGSENLVEDGTVNTADDCTMHAHGDNQMSHKNFAPTYVNQLFSSYKRPPYYFSEVEVKQTVDRVMLKEYFALAKHFMEFSEASCDCFPNPTNYYGILETIPEESEDGCSDGASERHSDNSLRIKQTDSQETTTEAKLSMSNVSDQATHLVEYTRTVLVYEETSTLSSDEEGNNVISKVKDVRNTIETADLDDVLMVSPLDLEECHQEPETFNSNFELDSFDETVYDDTPDYLIDEEILECITRMLMIVSQDLVNTGQKETEGLTEHLCINFTRDICKSESYGDSELDFLRYTEKSMMIFSENVEETLTEEMAIGLKADEYYLQNSKIQFEEDSPSPSSSVDAIESKLFGSIVRNFIWCDALSQFVCIEDEYFAQNSNSGNS